MSRRLRVFLLAALAVLAVVAVTLAFRTVRHRGAASPAFAGRTEAVAPRAGDRLLDETERIRVERLPATNLPRTLAATRGTRLLVESPPVPIDEWDYPEGAELGYEWTRLRGYEPGFRMMWCNFPVKPAPGSPPVTILKDGIPQEPWDRKSAVFPGETFWYDADRGTLHALARELPANVTLRYEVAADTVFEHVEPGLEAETASASSLKRRVELGGVVRDALWLPAPGSATIDVAKLAVDGLRVSVGVLDQGWAFEDGVLRPRTGLSDGVTFSVEVERLGGEGAPPERRTVWSRHVLPAEGFVDDRVDLSAYAGQDVRLHLTTAPGKAGNADFDYAVWGDLRWFGEPRRPPDRPHVVIVDIDTLRADRLGMYGYSRPTTPRLDRWAADHGLVFEDTVSNANWTLPSTVTMLTGLTVTQHGVTTIPLAMTAAHRSLARRLSEVGYETYGMCDGGLLAPAFGFDDGFEVYDARKDRNPDWKRALGWITDRGSERPVFLFVQTYLVHAPYRADERFLPHPGYGGRLAGKPADEAVFDSYRFEGFELTAEEKDYISRLYDAGIRRMDGQVAAFLEGVEQALAGDPFVLIFTSDHGEGLFEHGILGHGQAHYEELLKVPLIVHFSDGAPGRTSTPVSLLDLVPTVLEAAGIDVPAHLEGRSLRGALPEDRIRVAESPGENTRSIHLGKFKLIERGYKSGHPATLLFDLATDPKESDDLSQRMPDRVRELHRRLAEYQAKHGPLDLKPATGDLDRDLIQNLRALGYVDVR